MRGVWVVLLGIMLLGVVACQSVAGPVTSEPEAPPNVVEAPRDTDGPALAPGECLPASEGSDPAYRDPNVCVEARVDDLLARMSLAEKIGQMTLVEKNSIGPSEVTTYRIGGVLSGGGGYPSTNTAEAWAEMVDGYQKAALATPLGIPVIYGVDAVHGHNNMNGATIFPHNIGLGATRSPALVEQVARATAEEMIATGIYWNYAPVVAVPRDIRWGRTYEGFGEDTALVSEMGVAYLRGLQSVGEGSALGDPGAVLATPKHYVGDGGTRWGSSTTRDYQSDQGETNVDEETLRAIHLPPYEAAIDAGAMSIMVSFSGWERVKMHGQRYLLTEVLKQELGFEGFIVSDWEAIDQLPGAYESDVVLSIGAGLDMIMVPYEYERFIGALTGAVESGQLSQERIDDAVRRILTVKFRMGLFERPFSDPNALASVGSEVHRDLARQAVRESLVLLKNEESTLPLAKDAALVYVAGAAADDLGMQSGGWTIEWQGVKGNVFPGTTIRQAIEAAVSPDTVVEYDARGRFQGDAIADVAIVVVGEEPYAEGVGDRADLSLSDADAELIASVGERAERVVVVVISGRPLIVTEQLGEMDALVAAWLPGSEGQGVADVLFGDYPFTGRLPYTWPRSMEQVPLDLDAMEAGGCAAPLFPFGYGLDADDPSPELVVDCAGAGE